MDALQMKDFLHYRFLSALRYAPGGKSAAFVVSAANEEENCYDSCLWLYDGSLRQLTGPGRQRSFLWEDETHILFPADRSPDEKKRREAKEAFTSYYRLGIHGGEALHAFTLPFAASRLEKVGDCFVALGDIDANFPDYYKMTAQERCEVARHYEEDKDYEVLDEVPFWFNGQGMVNKRRTALFTISSQGEILRVTAPLFNVDTMAVAGDSVIFCGSEYGVRRPQKNGHIYRLDVPTGRCSLLSRHPQLEVGRMQTVGRQVWLSATDGQRHGINENHWVYRLDIDSGELQVISREEHSMYGSVGSDCRYGGGSQWQSRDGALYHLTTREGSSQLYRLTADGKSEGVITREGSIDALALCPEAEEALLIAMYDGQLQELYAADLTTGQVRQVSRFNSDILRDKYVADYQPLSVESCGCRINGWVLLPRNFDPARTYPAILDIHGGPKTVYGPVFYHEMQLWANMGYFVFFCNPKGGDGRDNDFMDIRGHYGETDYENLMDFTDAVLTAWPQIDPARLCVTGGSYGGFMTNWIIGHTQRFCCAASQRSISNWLSFCGVSDIGNYFTADQCGGDIFATPEKLWHHSPLRYAARVETPTLFIHADEDYRCPLEQGLQMYTALADRGIPARLCMFHGENHELSRSGKPRHRIRRLAEITDWFDTYAGRPDGESPGQ